MKNELKLSSGITIECDAPQLTAHVMYALLNVENKAEVTRLIARLIAEQSQNPQ